MTSVFLPAACQINAPKLLHKSELTTCRRVVVQNRLATKGFESLRQQHITLFREETSLSKSPELSPPQRAGQPDSQNAYEESAIQLKTCPASSLPQLDCKRWSNLSPFPSLQAIRLHILLPFRTFALSGRLEYVVRKINTKVVTKKMHMQSYVNRKTKRGSFPLITTHKLGVSFSL